MLGMHLLCNNSLSNYWHNRVRYVLSIWLSYMRTIYMLSIWGQIYAEYCTQQCGTPLSLSLIQRLLCLTMRHLYLQQTAVVTLIADYKRKTLFTLFGYWRQFTFLFPLSLWYYLICIMVPRYLHFFLSPDFIWYQIFI